MSLVGGFFEQHNGSRDVFQVPVNTHLTRQYLSAEIGASFRFHSVSQSRLDVRTSACVPLTLVLYGSIRLIWFRFDLGI